MKSIKIDDTLDITDVVCPVTFAKTLLKLEDMQEGQILEVILNDGEPIQNVPKSLKNEGHKIILVEKIGDKYRMLVERGE
ncbi:MAG: sulfurtransferase TusA family protein [Pelotomaculum sp.]|uniref:Predicted redox protein n=1 Tax=Pelotomaculum thermopropionicum (strain DSM 13744 / JCM 10971 / SI) TaxID=370438 RepID=A5D5R9_PELTS|nr:sulfurtransferase TusA family protein [Pelotomaculum sp.]BAF58424.1 predicted redox protein [Pelotomaculum thermopropionicum SI]